MASGAADDSAYAARVRAALEVNLQQALAAELIDGSDPAAGVRFPVRGLAVTPAGALHGGALNAIFELAGYIAVAPTLAHGEHAVTHAIATQFIRAAPADAWVCVRATLSRRGRNLAFVTATATLDDSAAPVIGHSQITKSIVTAHN